MKNLILLILILATVQAFGQKKGKVDPKDATIDSLTTASAMLTTQLDSTTKASNALAMSLDSVSKERDTYYGVYTTVKDKVLKYEYHPDSLSSIIDSLRANRDASLAAVTTTSAALSDSITILNTEITSLKATITKMEAATADKEALIAELKQLKELLDSGIITQEEYDAKKTKLMAKWQ